MGPVSVSQIQTYLGCPLKYRFQYIDKVPKPWQAAALSFGSSVHAALEYFHRERMAGRTPTPESIVSIFEADWHAANLEPLVFPEKETRESLTEKGRAMLALYLAEDHAGTPTAVEDAFECDLVDPETGEVLDVRLRGRIDLVEEGNTVVELKTAARTLEQGGLERHLQLSTYALVFFLLHGVVPKLRLDMLLKTKVAKLVRLPTSRSLEELAWTARVIERATEAIRAGHFFPNPSWRCTECEYYQHCATWRGG